MTRYSGFLSGFCFQKWRSVTHPKQIFRNFLGFCFRKWRSMTLPNDLGFCLLCSYNTLSRRVFVSQLSTREVSIKRRNLRNSFTCIAIFRLSAENSIHGSEGLFFLFNDTFLLLFVVSLWLWTSDLRSPFH